MKPEISFLSPQRILNTLFKETAFDVTKILNHDLLKEKKINQPWQYLMSLNTVKTLFLLCI